MICDRCGKEHWLGRVSFFNTDHLCPDCLEEETNHPDYEYARSVERDEVTRGNYNFPGVGWPGKGGRVKRVNSVEASEDKNGKHD